MFRRTGETVAGGRVRRARVGFHHLCDPLVIERRKNWPRLTRLRAFFVGTISKRFCFKEAPLTRRASLSPPEIWLPGPQREASASAPSRTSPRSPFPIASRARSTRSLAKLPAPAPAMCYGALAQLRHDVRLRSHLSTSPGRSKPGLFHGAISAAAQAAATLRGL
jgi:hypothetical protein